MAVQTRFGDLAMRLGFVTKKQLDVGLELQRALKTGKRRKQELLGALLVDLGVMTVEQVCRVLERKSAIERIRRHGVDPFRRVLVDVEGRGGPIDGGQTDRIVL